MNKMIVILAILIVALLLMPVSLAESELAHQFTFKNTITWDSTPDEVESVLKAGVERSEETIESIGTITVLQTVNESFAGYKCSKMAFLCYNNKLCSIYCYYNESDVGDVASLIEGLTEIYGVPHTYEYEELPLLDFLSGDKTMCDWNIGDETKIVVVNHKNDDTLLPSQYPYLCTASFENIPVNKQLQEAFRTQADNSEMEPDK